MASIKYSIPGADVRLNGGFAIYVKGSQPPMDIPPVPPRLSLPRAPLDEVYRYLTGNYDKQFRLVRPNFIQCPHAEFESAAIFQAYRLELVTLDGRRICDTASWLFHLRNGHQGFGL